MTLAEKLFEAGVVGAGGAGFPTHIKAGAEVEYMLANGAECEPLIHKDVELMKNHPEEVVRGMELMMEQLKASKGRIGVKTKNKIAIDAMKPFIKNDALGFTELGDFYPSGDEYELVYEATGRLIPAAGIPLQVGCVVNNVETLYNITKAAEGKPVTESFVCVTGAVKKSLSFWAPIGMSYREAIEQAGGITVKDYGVFVGGLMMGTLTFDLDQPITKTTAGFIVLPKDHYLIRRLNQPEKNWHRIGKSACDQCSYCTEFCPRYLLGYNVQPHKVMRSLEFTRTGSAVWNQMAELCCSCGLCTLYSCPEDLFPKEACDKAKKEMRELGQKYVQEKPVIVHPMKEGRRVPIKQLMKKLHVTQYEQPSPFKDLKLSPDTVTILLQQHIGVKAEPTVTVGKKVSKGDAIASPPEGKMGAKLHASIDGEISEITDKFIKIKKQVNS